MLAGMGLFDRILGKKTATPAPAAPASQAAAAAPAAPAPKEPVAPAAVLPRLAAARERLEAKDLPGAVALYEEILSSAGERADVLVTISGDLGSHGHVQEIVELIAPRYDAQRHGPATGLNVLQAYLALRNPEAAQHVLDILFGLNLPDLEERLHGFSNAIAELIEAQRVGALVAPPDGSAAGIEIPRVNLVTISKPIWSYGLESLAAEILPPKSSRLRRVAFAQLALPAVPDIAAAMKQPEDELGRLSRALPCWFAESLYFCPHYAPVVAVGVMDDKQAGSHYALFGADWSTENLRQLVDTSQDPIDFVFTGTLTQQSGDYTLTLRLWEIKKFRERKQFTARWTPATADAELKQLHAAVTGFMEFAPYPAGQGLAYTAPASPRAWLDALNVSLGLFLAEKNILPAARLAAVPDDLARTAEQAPCSASASLAWITSRSRAAKLGIGPVPAEPTLAADPVVAKARAL